MRYFLELSYDGTDFAGWQRQSNALTVQECIENTMSQILRYPTQLTGCGRTDKGVHARYFVAHCDLNISSEGAKKLLFKLNRMLPPGIACWQFTTMEATAHARYDAVSRSYEYSLHGKKNPFIRRYSTYYPNLNKLDLSLLHEVADIVKHTSNCSSFCKAHGGNQTMLCAIQESKWIKNDSANRLYYNIRADRFLRGMVRLIVGSSLSVASGKMTLSELTRHINEGSRSPLMKSAPAEGLALVDIRYDNFKRES